MKQAAVECERQRSIKTMQVVFACISLAMLAAGIAINWFARGSGATADMLDIAAFGMLLAAAAHAAALWLWDR